MGRKTPFSIFPEEIWRHVIEALDNPEDHWDLWQSHPQFQVVLTGLGSEGSWRFHQVFPHIIKWLDPEGILACRGVCKLWKTTVSQYLSVHPTVQPMSTVPETTKSPASPLLRGMSCSLLNLLKFHQEANKTQVEYHKANGVLGGHLRFTPLFHFSDDDGVPLELQEQHLTNLMMMSINTFDALGPHVAYLTVGMENFVLHPRMRHINKNSIQLCLNFTPELRSLIIEKHKRQYYHSWNEDPLSANSVVRLLGDDTYTDARFPSLPKLEALIFEKEAVTLQLGQRLYMQYGPQLKNAKIPAYLLEEEYTEDPVLKFRELHLTPTYSMNDRSNDRLYAIWTRKGMNCPNLEKLTLEVNDLSLKTLVEILKRCPVLRYLIVKCKREIQPITLALKRTMKKWKHPVLEVFEINNSAVMSYDFLEYFPCIRHLILKGILPNQKFSVQFHGAGVVMQGTYSFTDPYNGIYRSGIWSVLPELKKIEFRVKDGNRSNPARTLVFTREKYYSCPMQGKWERE